MLEVGRGVGARALLQGVAHGGVEREPPRERLLEEPEAGERRQRRRSARADAGQRGEGAQVDVVAARVRQDGEHAARGGGEERPREADQQADLGDVVLVGDDANAVDAAGPEPAVRGRTPGAAPLVTRASARSRATGFQRRRRVSDATAGKGLTPAVTSGGTTGNTETPASRQRRAVITQVTGVSRSASSSAATARSSSWLSSTTSVRPRAWRWARTRPSAWDRGVIGTPKRSASIPVRVSTSHAPTRNHWSPPGKRRRTRCPRAQASVDLPLPPPPTSASRTGSPRTAATSVASSRVRASSERGGGGNSVEPGVPMALRSTPESKTARPLVGATGPRAICGFSCEGGDLNPHGVTR